MPKLKKYNVRVIADGFPDFSCSVEAETEGKAASRAMIFCPHKFRGQMVHYEITTPNQGQE